MASNKKNRSIHNLRIIGGRWRGKKFRFELQPGLRPTSDRVRETLFNWLAPSIHGALCLDLFAGSGALGMEACSRGAKKVIQIENHRETTRILQQHIRSLPEDHCFELVCADALTWLQQPGTPADIIFLDPPFGKDMLNECFQRLTDNHWTKPGTLIYVESEASLKQEELPAQWHLLRAKKAGQVFYHLVILRPLIRGEIFSEP